MKQECKEDEGILQKAEIIMDRLAKQENIPIRKNINELTDLISSIQSSLCNTFKISSQNPDHSVLGLCQIPKKTHNQCSYFPLHWSLQNKDNQFFFYGGFCLDFTFKVEEDTPQKRLRNKINRVEHFKEKGIFMLHYDEQSPTLKNLNYLIKRAQSMCDFQYYILSLALMEFQCWIPEYIRKCEGKVKELRERNLLEKYEEDYQRFEQWALSEIMKLDTKKIFGFQIQKFNLETFEFEIKKGGHSHGLMALRGLDLKNPFQYMRKETYHFLDGESNIALLVNQISRFIKGKPMDTMQTVILSFDDLKIEVNLNCKQITNKDPSYPYRNNIDYFQSDFQGNHDFFLNFGEYNISPEVLSQVLNARANRTPAQNNEFNDFTYALESQIFLEKFYKKK